MRISDWSSDVCSSDLTTISDLHRFAEMLRRGGEIDGVRLLSPAMIRFAARHWIGDRPNMVWDPILSERGWSRFPDNIGLGFRVRGEGRSEEGSVGKECVCTGRSRGSEYDKKK